MIDLSFLNTCGKRHLVCTVNDTDWTIKASPQLFHSTSFTVQIKHPNTDVEKVRLCVHNSWTMRSWHSRNSMSQEAAMRSHFPEIACPSGYDEKQLSRNSMSYKARSWLSRNECQVTILTLTTWRSIESRNNMFQEEDGFLEMGAKKPQWVITLTT